MHIISKYVRKCLGCHRWNLKGRTTGSRSFRVSPIWSFRTEQKHKQNVLKVFKNSITWIFWKFVVYRFDLIVNSVEHPNKIQAVNNEFWQVQ